MKSLGIGKEGRIGCLLPPVHQNQLLCTKVEDEAWLGCTRGGSVVRYVRVACIVGHVTLWMMAMSCIADAAWSTHGRAVPFQGRSSCT